jgi:hemerythrin-like domain-containing protein
MDFPSTPTADFDHPLDILDGCHQRIRRHSALVVRIAEHLQLRGVDADAAKAAGNVVRFMDTAGSHHHRDEEVDLFPALEKQVSGGERELVHGLLDRLREDHRHLDIAWSRMKRPLDEIAAGRDARITPNEAREFSAAYERHIALEESELLPLARRILDLGQVARLGLAMARRRGARPGASLPLPA